MQRGDKDTETEAKKDDEIERGWGWDTEQETEKEAERWTLHRLGIRNRELNRVLKLSDFIQRRFSFYFFPEIRRKEDEAAFSISTKNPFPRNSRYQTILSR